MGSRHAEVERTYDLPRDDLVLPDLTGAGPVAAVVDAGTDELSATYVDTDDLRLLRHRVTLRRRTGGADAGWHLKLPAEGDARQEVHWPLGEDEHVPGDVRAAVTSFVLDGRLRPVVHLTTSRRRSLLVGAGQEPLAEVCDDTVSATVLDDAAAGSHVTTWREVEVELVGGGTDVLDAAEARLVDAGAVRAAIPSKLARALSGHPALEPSAPAPDLPTGSGGAVLLGYVAEHLERLRRADVDLRLDPDGPGVHDLRVQARRLRTALAVHRSLLDEPTARHLEQELKLLGRVLSQVRDQQVLHETFADRLADVVPSEEAETLRGVLVAECATTRERSTAAARAALTSSRYVALVRDLEALVHGTGVAEGATAPAEEVLVAGPGRALRRLERVARAARSLSPPDDRESLHELRKAAKRLRYACEVAEPVGDEAARRLGRRAKRLQGALGDLLDHADLLERLPGLAAADGADGPRGFVLGRLHALLERRVAESGQQAWDAVRRVRRAGKAWTG